MIRTLLAGLALAIPALSSAMAQDTAAPPGLDERINALVGPVADALSSVIFFSVPVAGARAAADRGLADRGRPVLHRLSRLHQRPRLRPRGPAGQGRLFRPATTPARSATSRRWRRRSRARSGLGNIAGVAVAISLGGPGATFWMILAGLIGMSSKFAECTLAVKYRNEYADGTVSGGPMYYLRKGLAERGLRRSRPGPGRRLRDLLRVRLVRRRQHVPGQPELPAVPQHRPAARRAGSPTRAGCSAWSWRRWWPW